MCKRLCLALSSGKILWKFNEIHGQIAEVLHPFSCLLVPVTTRQCCGEAGILSGERKVRQHWILLVINCHTVGKKGFDQKVIKFRWTVGLKLYDQNLSMDAGSKLIEKLHSSIMSVDFKQIKVEWFVFSILFW